MKSEHSCAPDCQLGSISSFLLMLLIPRRLLLERNKSDLSYKVPPPTKYTLLSGLDNGSNEDGTSRSPEEAALQILKEDTVSVLWNHFLTPE